MLTTPRSRLLSIAVLVAALGALFVLQGAGWVIVTGGSDAIGSVGVSQTDHRAASAGTDVVSAIAVSGDRAESQPWEITYKYAISAIAFVWVGLRLLGGWRLDGRTIAFAPRDAGSPDRPIADRSEAPDASVVREIDG